MSEIMTFSEKIKLEILSEQPKMNCCKKAFLFGLLFNSVSLDNGRFSNEFGFEGSAQRAYELLGDVAEPTIENKIRAGRRKYLIEYTSKSFSSFIGRIKNGQSINEASKFRCAGCESAFLGGIIASLGSANDPQKGYRLEIVLYESNSDRADALWSFISGCGFEMKKTVRNGRIVLYLKNNSTISDMLSFAGAMTQSFDMTNTYIERDIRNIENRATNFVAKNISKSVDAAHRHISAINKLIENNMLETLPRELYETAVLRLENYEVSLSELALMHEPPITKSGLNHRLTKICKEADEISD